MQQRQKKPSKVKESTDGTIVVEGPEGATAKFLDDRYVSLSLHSDEPTTAREYAELLFLGLKDGSLSQRDWFRMLSGAESVPEGKTIAVPAERFAYYRKVLDAVVRINSSPTLEAREIVEGAIHLSINYIEGRVAAIPRVRMNPRRLQIDFEYQVVGRDQQAAFDYAFYLVLSSFRKDVRKCQLDSCARFFLKSRGRDKQREYCCIEHRNAAGKLTASERVQASRARVEAHVWLSMKQVDPTLTPGKWKEIKSSRPNLTAEKWLQQRGIEK